VVGVAWWGSRGGGRVVGVAWWGVSTAATDPGTRIAGVSDYAFDRDTAVSAAGAGSYTASVSSAWNVGDKPNGGYLLAIAARAMAAEAHHPDPVSITAHFLRPGVPDASAAIAVEQLKAGRAVSTVTATLLQDGSERMRLVGAFSDLGATPPAVSGFSTGSSPDLPPPEDCIPGQSRLPNGVDLAIARQFDLRFPPEVVGWYDGRPSGRAEIGGWFRFADDRPPDPIGLLLVADAWPPAILDAGIFGWVPTVELTVHVRARPAPGWLRCWIRTRFVMGWWLEEDAEVWDADGRLVAMSRQLARVPLPG
jgi:acyl-CoA thioesterase